MNERCRLLIHIFEMLKTSISALGTRLIKKKGQYYLPNAKMIFDTLLMQLAKIISLPYKTEITDDLLGTMDKIYSHYSWIISRINPNSGLFKVGKLEKLKQVRENYLNLLRQ